MTKSPRKRSIKFQPDSDEDTEKDTSLTASAKKKKRVSWAEKLEHVKLFGGDEKEFPKTIQIIKSVTKVVSSVSSSLTPEPKSTPKLSPKQSVKSTPEPKPSATSTPKSATKSTPKSTPKQSTKSPVLSFLDAKDSSLLPADKIEDVDFENDEDAALESDENDENEDIEAGENGKSENEKPEKKKKTDKKVKKPYEKFDYKTAMERTVFVGNVSLNVKAGSLKKLFSPYGKIEAIYKRSLLQKTEKLTKKMFGTDKELKTTVTEAHIYVRFADEEAAKSATELNGTLINGRNLRVTLSSDKSTDPLRSLFVGNLPYKTGEQSLMEFFADKVGKIDSVRIVHDKATGLGKGYGFVTFQDVEQLAKALKELQGQRFKGRNLRLTKMSKKKNNCQLASPMNAKRRSDTAKQHEMRGLKHKLANYTVTKKTFAVHSAKEKLSKKVVKTIKKRKQNKVKSRTLLS